MDQDLQLSLANNAKAWQALSLFISSAEKTAFDKTHDALFVTYGAHFMAHVYRLAFEKVLQNMPDAERSKLFTAFQQATESAIDQHYSTHPSVAACLACHARKP
ncbi:hypothetical protein SAMN02745146_1834 [Hymenobacter daecheongensis DSM 21074]|uniref:Uncharacterized protein n=1 Tax=Hymenobacter daecheongensis DSM 21074 TaxID=1121955 RepID=A0A1M6EVX7_9BACT|nr:hypothetical protein [Hymenobacter daecheongensis]SHI89540.1 hypothetical protein SAMN02745146_1834 [Hymenobacter daecheongensis DSM 21074]